MKSLIVTLAVFLVLTQSLKAKIITVNNLAGGQYSSLVDAYNAAASGDTIYLEATNISYGSLTGSDAVSKQLTFVGVGFNPDTEDQFLSILDRVSLDNNSSGCRLYGLIINILESTTSTPLSNLVVENCRISSYIDVTDGPVINMLVRNCIFNQDNRNQFADPRTIYFHDADTIVNRSTVTIANCYFIHAVNGYNNSHNLLVFDHCIFGEEAFDAVQNALVSNSIFYQLRGGLSGAPYTSFQGGNNVFLNNIIWSSGSVGLNNSGSGNMFSTNPLFVDDGASSYLWSPTENYNLQSGSPGIGAATDSTDIGIHGGHSNFSNSGETLWLPIVRAVTFVGDPIPLVQPGDTLRINIETSRPKID